MGGGTGGTPPPQPPPQPPPPPPLSLPLPLLPLLPPPAVQVGGGSHAWLYNKLLKLFGERVKTVVQVRGANFSAFSQAAANSDGCAD